MIPGLPRPGPVPRVPSLPESLEFPEPAEIFDAPDPLWFSLKEQVEGLSKRIGELRDRIQSLEGRVAALEQGPRVE